MEVKEILCRFDELADEIKALETALSNAIKEAVSEIAKENPHGIKRIAHNCFIVNSREIVGKPWNPSYYDWEASGKVVLDYLQRKDVKQWKSILQEKLKNCKGKDVEFESKIRCQGYDYVTKTPIERSFIEKIIGKL